MARLEYSTELFEHDTIKDSTYHYFKTAADRVNHMVQRSIIPPG